ncbi:DUF4365 domain-containing protein [Actinomadura geliboluensis]|uniref:DUF4365 domain-containing protein n=1 Tax=Actinomadura geliboluensis TaxID=882440 RepID=UPI003716A7DD
MDASANAPVEPIGTLNNKVSKARFGVAYLRAICSHAGVGFTETSTDEDVLAVDGNIEFPIAAARVQVKCTGQFRIKGGKTATWSAEEGWWKKWKGSKLPVYLVLVVVDPDTQEKWLEHREDGTLHRAAAFWVRVDTMEEADSIVVPKIQRLTAATLSEWAVDLNACFMQSKKEV